MTTRTRGHLALLALCLVPSFTTVDGQTPRDPLLGNWRAVAVEVAGRPTDMTRMPPVRLTIGTDGAWRDADGITATWKADTTVSPARLVISYAAGPEAGKTQHCVYSVYGDELKIVFSVPGAAADQAPTRLDSVHKPRLMLMTFLRQP